LFVEEIEVFTMERGYIPRNGRLCE